MYLRERLRCYYSLWRIKAIENWNITCKKTMQRNSFAVCLIPLECNHSQREFSRLI